MGFQYFYSHAMRIEYKGQGQLLIEASSLYVVIIYVVNVSCNLNSSYSQTINLESYVRFILP